MALKEFIQLPNKVKFQLKSSSSTWILSLLTLSNVLNLSWLCDDTRTCSITAPRHYKQGRVCDNTRFCFPTTYTVLPA